MKTEKQCMEKLEKAVDAITAACAEIKDGAKATDEQAGTVVTWLSTIGTLAWVLDQEDKMRPILAQIKLAGLANDLKAKAEAAKVE